MTFGNLGEPCERNAFDPAATGTFHGAEPVTTRQSSEAVPLAVSQALRGHVRDPDVLGESRECRPEFNDARIGVHDHGYKSSPLLGQSMRDEIYPATPLDGDMPIDKKKERADRAARLRQARIAAGYTSMPQAATAARVKVATYKAHEMGANGFDTPDARLYARAFKVSASWLMTGDERQEAPENGPVMAATLPHAPVMGEVAAGRLLSVDFHDETVYEPVPFVPGRFPTLRQFAYRVVGQSMDLKRIEDGDFVICVPYSEARGAPISHDIVVVEAQTDGHIERTCKELIVTDEAFEFWPRSSNPAFSRPIVVPKSGTLQGEPWPTENANISIQISGLVIGRFRPFGQGY